MVAHSSARTKSPELSAKGLTLLLGLMCLVPTVTIFALWLYMPPVYEGALKASVRPVGLPDPTFYEADFRDRQPVSGGEILVRNEGDQAWTHINIQINGHYQIYDIDPLDVGEERVYLLDRFVSRTGARFDLRYNPLRNVQIYARRPTRDRATFYESFEAPE